MRATPDQTANTTHDDASILRGTNEAVISLPQCARKIDRELIDRAVSHLRSVLAKTVVRGMEEVGNYLLQAFYDDDPELYYSTHPNKHVSLRLLMQRCESLELPVSRTFLSRAIRLAAISKELPRAAAYHQLPPSHRVELLRLKAPDALERLASKALAHKLNVRKLRALVQQETACGASHSSRGRKRVPQPSRTIAACLRVLRDKGTGKLVIRRNDVEGMTREHRAQARTALAALEKLVRELRRLMI